MNYLHHLISTKKNKRLVTFIAVALILLTMFLIAFLSSHGAFGDPGDSGIVDEIAHIPAGYTYIHDLDYRLNPEHPPVAKALAGLSLNLNKTFKGPEDNWTWNAIDQWDAGWYMIYQTSNDPAAVFTWARFPMILLMLGLGLFLYKWASELFGRKVGLLTLALYAFYPDVLGHGRLVTTDIAAAFGFVVATYYFDKALTKRTVKYTIYAGLAFGLAQLLKFSAFLLFGVFLILVCFKAFYERKETKFWSGFWQYFKIYFWTAFISIFVVWLVYLPLNWRTPVDIEHKLIETNLGSSSDSLFFRNFLHHFEANPITRAIGHYALGVMLVFVRVSGGNATYAIGHLSDKSISWFFPFAWIVKTPISIIALFLSSLGLLFRKAKDKKTVWLLTLILVPWFVYWTFTLKGQLNIGIRHLMPTVPFVLLMIAFLFNYIFNVWKLKYLQVIAVLLVVFEIVSTLSYYPSFIAYFNEFVPRDQRYKYLVDSSLDWGQDLLRLEKYVNDNHITNIKVDYFGGGKLGYSLPNAQEWHSSYGPTTGWLAVSATYYQSSKLYGPREGKWDYEWLDGYKPTAQIGGSILVFHITEDDLHKNPPKSPYPITKFEYPGQISINTGKVGL